MRRLRLLAVLSALMLVAVACAEKAETTTKTQQSDQTDEKKDDAATKDEKTKEQLAEENNVALPEGVALISVQATADGNIEFELKDSKAPRPSFYYEALAAEGWKQEAVKPINSFASRYTYAAACAVLVYLVSGALTFTVSSDAQWCIDHYNEL